MTKCSPVLKAIQSSDLVVIGGGSARLTAVDLASRLGAHMAIIITEFKSGLLKI